MEEFSVKNQLKLSIPIAFESLVNVLMTVIDTLLVTTLGLSAIGAVGAMGTVINLMLVIVNTILISNNTIIANLKGAKDTEGIKKTTGNSIIMALLFSFIIMVIVFFVSPIFPSLFKVNEICLSYLNVRLIGFLPLVVLTILSGHERTMGNTKKILIIRILSLVFNLIFNLVAIKLGYNIVGVAFATIIIDILVMIYLIVVTRKTVIYKYIKEYFDKIFNLAKWNFVERIVSRTEQFIFNILVSRMGEMEYAVHVILIQIVDIFEQFISGFQTGITINVGIALGRKSEESVTKIKSSAKKIIKGMAYVMPIIIFLIAMIVMFISFDSKKPMYIFLSIIPIILVIVLIISQSIYYFSLLRGMKDFSFLAKRNMISSVIKIIVALFLSVPFGIVGVWVSYVVYAFMQFILSKKRFLLLEKTII